MQIGGYGRRTKNDFRYLLKIESESGALPRLQKELHSTLQFALIFG